LAPGLPGAAGRDQSARVTGSPNRGKPIVPGSVRVLASTGDERNALLTLTMTMAGGPFGAAAAPCARLYLLDDNNKISTEHVTFYVAPE